MTELFTSFGRAVRHSEIAKNNLEISQFKDQVERGDKNGAFESLVRCKNPDNRNYMLKTVIETRRNDDVRKVLDTAKELFDDHHGKKDQGTEEGNKMEALYQKSILVATLNDDPETLKEILNWGKRNDMKNESPNQIDANPVLLASLEGYVKCMKHLYRSGFRIQLVEEDWRGVKDQTKKNSLKFLKLQSCPEAQMNSENSVEKICIFRSFAKSVTGLVVKEGTCNDKDQVNRYLRFKAYANQDYLSLELIYKDDETALANVDPLRKAFALGTYAKVLAEYHSEHSKEYRKIGENCEKFATDILAHCHNAKDVMRLLRYDPMEEHSDEYKYSNWNLALRGEHKSFVAHPYYQHFAYKRLKGTQYDPYKINILGQVLSALFALLLVPLYIPVILVDLALREGQLLWETPGQFKARKLGKSTASRETSLKVLQSGERTVQDYSPTILDTGAVFENYFWAFFRERLHRPVYRMYSMALCEMVFLVFLILGLTESNDGNLNFSWKDIITSTLICHFLFEDLVELFIRKWDFFTSFWSCYTLFTNCLLLSGAAITYVGFMGNVEGEKEDFRSQHSGNHPINIGTTMIAYGGVMHVLRVLRWFLLNRRIGPVVVCFIRVLKDVIYIFAVFVVIYVAFVLGLWFMYKPFTVAGGGVDPKTKVCSEDSMFCTGDKSIMENAGMREMFSHIFWKVFDGDAKQDAMIQTREEFMKNSTVFSLEFSHFMGYSMWAMYQGLTVILLMTILIAQMNSTYQRVWENVDAEWKYSKCFSQVQFLTPRAILPPPFRWVYYLARLIK
jgi:hypothetical protein